MTSNTTTDPARLIRAAVPEHRVRERGVAMLLVLIAVAIATVLSMSFLSSQATSLGVAQNVRGHAQARSVAESALVVAINYVQTDADWRTDKSQGQWVSSASFNGGTFDLYAYDGLDTDGDGVVDDTDGDLADDATDPVTLKVVGDVNGVSHTVFAVVTAGEAPDGLNVLMVVANASSLTSQDDDVQSLLESWGHTVTPISDHDSQSNFNDAFALNDVVYVTSQSSYSSISSKLNNASIGVVYGAGSLSIQLGLGTSGGYTYNTQVDITDNSHYITSPFSTGLVTIGSSFMFQQHYISSTNPAGVTTLAERVSSSSDTLMAVDVGGALNSGSAPGRRVKMPWGPSSFDINTLTSDGETILQRSLDWAGAEITLPLPMARWALEEASGTTAADSMSLSNGTYRNSPTLGQPGTNGLAAHFDGSNDYVEVPHDDAMLLDDGTISFWFNADNTSGHQAMFSKDSSGYDTGGHCHIYLDGSTLKVRFQSNSTSYTLQSSSGISSGDWHHVVLTFGSEGLALYLDGVQVDTDSYTGGMGTTSGGTGNYEPLAIGAGTWSSGNLTISSTNYYYDGLIDDVRIYDSALGAGQVSQIYSGSDSTDSSEPQLIALYEFEQVAPSPPALVSHWKMDDSGGTLQDGYTTAYGSSQSSNSSRLRATQVTFAQGGEVQSISAYIRGTSSTREVAFALYEDNSGEPGNLVVSSSSEELGTTSWHWHTLPVTPTQISAGTYWLAIGFESSNMYYAYTSGGSARHKVAYPISSGFPSSWGSSGYYPSRTMSIYANMSDTTVVDETGLEDGSMTNGASNGAAGHGDGGTAIEFDGTDDYVEIPHNDAYLLDSGSVSLWFKADVLSGETMLFSKDSNNYDTGGHLTIYTSGSNLFARLQSTSSHYYVSASGLSTGTWYHAVVSWGSGGLKLFRDGVEVDTDSYTGGLGTTSGGVGNYEPIAIGANTYRSDDLVVTPLDSYFDGVIDEVKVFDQGLNESQAGEVYAGGDPSAGLASTVYDTSDYGTSLDLDIEDPGNVSWVPGGGLTIDTATRISSASAATKLYTALTATDEMSLAVQFTPENDTQNGPARIVSYSGGSSSRNFTFGQDGDEYITRLKTSSTTSNGTPEAESGSTLTAGTQEYVIVSYDGENITMYRDGGSTVTLARTGTLDWDSSFGLMFGDEVGGGRDWLGTLHRVGVYDKAFNQTQADNVFGGGDPGDGTGGTVNSVDWVEQ